MSEVKTPVDSDSDIERLSSLLRRRDTALIRANKRAEDLFRRLDAMREQKWGLEQKLKDMKVSDPPGAEYAASDVLHFDGTSGNIALYARTTLTLEPGERGSAATGVVLRLDRGCRAVVLPVPSARRPVVALGSVVPLEPGSAGEVIVVLANADKNEIQSVRTGDQIGQLLIYRPSITNVRRADAF